MVIYIFLKFGMVKVFETYFLKCENEYFSDENI